MNLETKITIYKFTPQLFTLTLHKATETSEGGCIGFRGAYLSQAFQSRYLLADVSVKRLFLPVVMKVYDYIIRYKYAGLG